MNIVFLLSHIPNPRMNKRIAIAKQIDNVIVVCVRRSSQDIWEPYHKDVKHNIINVDLPSTKHIFKRLRANFEYMMKANSMLMQNDPKLIYAEGLDSLNIAVKYQKDHPGTKIFFEVADLREIFLTSPTSLVQKLFKVILTKKEKRLMKSVDRLVVTSEKFYDLHYFLLITPEKTLLIPNLPDIFVFSDYRHKQTGKFTIGFIGGIRYLDQMKMLVDAADACGVNILFAGKGGTDTDDIQIRKYCQGKEHIEFFGRYSYESQIAELYSRVDCVYCVYDADNPNARIALPNKLYESIYCELPIFVARGTYLAELVEQWGVGIAVSHRNMNELIEAINKVMKEDVRECIVASCHTKKKELFGSHPEEILKNDLNKMLGS